MLEKAESQSLGCEDSRAEVEACLSRGRAAKALTVEEQTIPVLKRLKGQEVRSRKNSEET